MTEVEVVIKQTIHVHGMAMDAAVSHVINTYTGPGNPGHLEITARYVGESDD